LPAFDPLAAVVLSVPIHAKPRWRQEEATMTFETLVNIIVFVNLGLTIELWRRAALPGEKLKKKFRDRLWLGKPITPKHEPPPPLEARMIRKPEEFNSDFEDFANVINWHLVDYSPWRVQELPTFELSKLAALHPAYGRCYAVFHNQVRVGEIELEPDYNYSTEAPRVTIHIELNWLRLLPFETIRNFLTHVALNTFDYQRGTLEYFEMNQKIDLALIDVLWKTQRISRFGLEESEYGRISVRLKGSASDYLEDSRRWRAFRNQAANTDQRE
jgi:hypothetical protein